MHHRFIEKIKAQKIDCFVGWALPALSTRTHILTFDSQINVQLTLMQSDLRNLVQKNAQLNEQYIDRF
ncbi:hypothetical protein WA1_03085 [Scytonema hofmannii PCC 7110]|uniref:Uncharacterized protein n=1 Tax=Scytonema hofmannii PCC 7110 TaxID=128403 RepID=A0A139XHH2_9CYAN|nr:hypothetical protein WA1_03085 [Scytonema hofmannii PCC 7110]